MRKREKLWAENHRAWRDPRQVVLLDSAPVPQPDLEMTIRGDFWGLLEDQGVTILASREYENLLVALSIADGHPRVSYLSLPHPSGIAVDAAARRVWVACTRNPNQIVELRPATDHLDTWPRRPLLPWRLQFLPGSTYLHDLALVGGSLHGNSVGSNAVLRIAESGARRAWWPRSIEGSAGPDFSRNYLQLNSIAAGATLKQSFFTASAERPSARRPGHKNWPVDRRGVVFDGASREVMARHLTRPHSARLWRRRVWLDNSGYGEFGFVESGGFRPVLRLPGWTRGLKFCGGLALVGTSRILPRFRQYAPGLDPDAARCGLHWIDPGAGRCLASLYWPNGNQIFAIETVAREVSDGLPYPASMGRQRRSERLFYSYSFPDAQEMTR
jgi:uncharacterized protein (TIGR03032 family)